MTTPNRMIPVAFQPGDLIKEEAEYRGWTPEVMAEKMNCGWTPETIIDLYSGRQPIVTETAKSLAKVFGTSVEIWTNLRNAYQRAKRKGYLDAARIYRQRPPPPQRTR